MNEYIDIVFDGPPGPVSGCFIEVERPDRSSISVGEWVERDDGFWALRIPNAASLQQRVEALERALRRIATLGAGTLCTASDAELMQAWASQALAAAQQEKE